MTVLPTYYLCHGGGPWHVMGGDWGRGHAGLRQCLEGLAVEIDALRPQAVLLVSAHWEAAEFRVQAQAKPPLLYDYGGFPPDTYQLRYAASGAPTLAVRVQSLLHEAGLDATADTERGYDHGVFVPMALLRPAADLPVLQLSLQAGLDPARHLAAGRALAVLRQEGVLIIASGSSWHNLHLLGPAAHEPSLAWDGWLQQTLTGCGGAERSNRLSDWQDAPAARLAHPREEHLLPLMVAVGAAENAVGVCNYREQRVFGGPTLSGYRFG